MKKRFLSFMSLLLVLVMCVSCSTVRTTDADSADQLDSSLGEESFVQDGGADQGENTGETQITAPMLNGVELSKYTIVYSASPDYNKRAAQYIKNAIAERAGIELEIVTDSNKKTDFEIVVGECKRDISTALDANTQGVEFAILADGTNIAMEGDYFVIAAAAYYFVETYITGELFSSQVPEEISICTPIVKEAKNFIFLIGDGMGEYQTLLHQVSDKRNARTISDGEDIFYGYMLPYIGRARTNSLSGTTDSAASGTALATGYKTVNGYIGKNSSLKDVTSLTELAASLGKATAVMSTEASTGATPAAFSAHSNSRDDSTTILNSQSKLKTNSGTIIKCDFNTYTKDGVKSIETNVNSVLEQLSKDEDGFFIMYEEAHIDKHSHNKDMNNAFLALSRFNQVIGVFMEFAFYNPDTFVLITADHETGNLLPNGSGGFTYGSGSHSPQYVPVFAYGVGAEVFHSTVVENVQIPKTIAKMWGVSNFGDTTSSYKSLI